MDVTPLLELMVRLDASDLFFIAGTQVKLKVDGVIRSIGEKVMTDEMCREAVASVMNEAQAVAFVEQLELDFAISLGDRGRFRVNIFHHHGTPGMVLRYIKTKIPNAKTLRLPPVLTELIMHKHGVILMVGATGSGKSTTLAAMLDHRNEHSNGHILTIEDPIEFVHTHKQCLVTQRELGHDTHSYAAALRSALREASDVVLIGEVRDRATMEAALELAGTGNLAISTMHANNAHQALERIINLFPQELHKTLFMDLSITMRAIISQRLLRGRDGRRCAAIEILVNTPHIADLIREGKVDEVSEAMQQSTDAGMRTFDQALIDLYREKRITLEEALANSDSAANLEARINFG
jgi:twitching motility protein PilU